MVFWICLTHACPLLEDKTIDDDYLVPGILAKYGLVNDTVKCKYIVELTRTQALTDTVMAFVFDPTKQKL